MFCLNRTKSLEIEMLRSVTLVDTIQCTCPHLVANAYWKVPSAVLKTWHVVACGIKNSNTTTSHGRTRVTVSYREPVTIAAARSGSWDSVRHAKTNLKTWPAAIFVRCSVQRSVGDMIVPTSPRQTPHPSFFPPIANLAQLYKRGWDERECSIVN